MNKSNVLRISTVVCVVLSLLAGFVGGPVENVAAVSPHIVISQVYGGGGNAGAPYTHDYVELFNRSDSPVSLAGWSIQYASATGTGNFGATATQLTELPNVIVQPGQYYLVQQGAGTGNGVALPTPDLIDPTPIAMAAGAGKVALVSQATTLGCNGGSTACSPAQLALIIDLVGYGNANFFEGSAAAPTLTNTTAAFRALNGCQDTDNNSADFSAAAPAPRNSASLPYNCGNPPTLPTGIGAAYPPIADPGGDVTLTVAVTPGQNPTSSGLTVVANLSLIGGSTTQPFFDDGSNGDAVAGDLVFSYATSVPSATTVGPKFLPFSVSDAQARSTNGTIQLVLPPPFYPIYEIQSAAHLSPLDGVFVSTGGIVTAVATNGFYMQNPFPDGDDATSEGLFVFTSSAPTAAVGDDVFVTGTVTEFRPGGSGGLNNLTLTEISTPGRSVTVLSSGNPLPAATVIGLGGRVPPTEVIDDDAFGNVELTGSFDPYDDGIDFYESLEGMLVQVNDPIAVGPRNSFGEIAVVSDGGAYASVRTNRGGIVIQPGDFNPERIILDDTLLGTPQVHTGDGFSGPAVGVLDYSFGNFKLYITQPLERVDNGIQREVTQPGPEHKLSVGAFNVENLDPFDPPEKFNDLANIVVNHMLTPDILTLEEIQDNNGATNNGVVDADVTLSMLISAIQAAGGPLYEYRQINPVNNQDGGEPGGNIRVGFLFNPERVSFVDRPGGDSTTAVGVVAGPDGPQLSFSPGRIDPLNPAFSASRKPLAGEFLFGGETVFLVANHFNSKSGDTPLFGRYQPPVLLSEIQRVQQAQIVSDFVTQILSIDPDASVLVLGDLNDFEFSPPLQILELGGMNPLVKTLPLEERYTYVFDGNSQVLDHILVSDRLLSVPLFYDIVHVNAEFFDQVSDHDPQVAYLCVDRTAPVVNVSVTPNRLWPPRHQYVNVSATVEVWDNADPAPTVTLLSVTSSEPDNGLGDGDTPNDIVIVNDLLFKLRAERAGTGSGRVYTITYQVTDGCGNSTIASATVLVPFSQGQ